MHRIQRTITHLSEGSALWKNELNLCNYSNGLVHITLNRPKKLNALSPSMIFALSEILYQLRYDSRCSAVLLTSSSKAFCAGGDVQALANADASLTKRFFAKEYFVNHLVANFGKPYISTWDGLVMGGGCGISLHGKYRIATENTLLGMPETAIGLCPDVGAAHFLHRITKPIGLYLGMTGTRLNGKDVLDLGLATHFVTKARIPHLIEKFQNDDINDESSILTILKSFEEQPTISASLSKEIIEIAEHYFDESRNSAKEILECLSSSSNSEAQKIADKLRSLCPLSCECWLRHFRAGKDETLKKTLERDFRLIQAFALHDDNFREGVRARLRDKDNLPNWKPSHLNDVSMAAVDAMFENEEVSSMGDMVEW